jgi:hypothetical protein
METIGWLVNQRRGFMNKTTRVTSYIVGVLFLITLTSSVWAADPNDPNNIVATPVFTPDGGVYQTAQTVAIACATPGATIRYTTDGSDPNDGTIIENGDSVIVSVDPPTILKAKAFKTGFTMSNVKTAAYYHYAGGSGDPNDPYQIDSRQILLLLAIDPARYSKCFILTADIDLNGQVFNTAIIAPDINNNMQNFQGTAFTGTFDGNGYKITHVTINGGGGWYLGFFGHIGSGGQIKNIGLEGFTVSGSNHSHCVGGLAGYNSYGSINNCYVSGEVSGASYLVGGLVGYNSYGSINNCYSTAVVNGVEMVGGLLGYNTSGNITNCYATGTVSGNYCVGGLLGNNYSGNITNCYATGTVSGSGSDYYTGGLVGNNNGSISSCYSTGTVSGYNCIGGLAGRNGGSISNCYAAGIVSGSGSVGGLLGYNDDGSISKCYSTGFVSGSSYVGGLVGTISGNSSITNSFWDTQTSCQTTSAGGTSKTTAQMQTLSTFTSAGWDFSDTDGDSADWFFPTPANYPILFWEVLDPNTVEPPMFSIPSGTYNTEQTVSITCATPGATIH